MDLSDLNINTHNDMLFPVDNDMFINKKNLDCGTCGLSGFAHNPNMKPFGRGLRKIAIVLDHVGKMEDSLNDIMCGGQTKFLKKAFAKYDIDLERDCKKFTVMRCPSHGKKYTKEQMDCCKPLFIDDLKVYKPDLIFAFGNLPIQSVLYDAPVSVNSFNSHGYIVPSYTWNCPVVCVKEPYLFIEGTYPDGRKKKGTDFFVLDNVIEKGLDRLQYIFKDRRIDENNGNYIISNIEHVRNFFDVLMQNDAPVGFDYEATGLDYFSESYKLLTASFSFDDTEGWVIPIYHPQTPFKEKELKEIEILLSIWLKSNKPKIIQNSAYEDMASRCKLNTEINNVIFDPMTIQHIVDNRAGGICGQKFQCYVRYGTSYDEKIDQSNLIAAKLEDVCKYNSLDTRYLMKWVNDLVQEIPQESAYVATLYTQCIKDMTDAKYRGIRLDLAYMAKLEKMCNEDTERCLEIERNCNLYKQYRFKYGEELDSGSEKKLKKLLYKMLGYKPLKRTTSGEEDNISLSNKDNFQYFASDDEAIDHVLEQAKDNKEVVDFLNNCKAKAKAIKLNGFIQNWKKLNVNGYLHPSFLIHTTVTGRSSCVDPNIQQVPKHDDYLKQLRKALIARNDGLLEVDYASAEMRFIAMCSDDNELQQFILSDGDVHRYWAANIYAKDGDDISKTERQNAKNKMVFPLVYGSFYKPIANALKLSEEWIKKVENEFWTKHFEIREWQNNLLDLYQENGYITNAIGYRMYAPMTRNKIFNGNIQGISFQCLMASFHDINAELKEKGLKSIIVGQIHDSIIIDFVKAELNEVLKIVRKHMCKVRWDFMKKVPLDVEFSIGRNMGELSEILDYDMHICDKCGKTEYCRQTKNKETKELIWTCDECFEKGKTK